MVKKQSNLLLKGVKKILSLNTTSNTDDPESMYIVGKCPKCNRNIIETEGFYSCRGKLLDVCDYKVSNTFEGDYLSFEEVLKFGKYQKMIKSGFLEDDSISSKTAKYNIEEDVKKEDVKQNKEMLKKEPEDTSKSLGKCPKCGAEVVSNGSKYTCTKCDYTLNGFFSKTKIPPSAIKTLLNGEYTEWMKFTGKNGGTYNSRLMLDKKNYNYARVPYENKSGNKPKNNNQNSLGKCPICRKDIIAGNNAFGCMGIKDKSCTFKIPFKLDGISVDLKNVSDLLKGDTILKKEENGEEVFLKIDRDGVLERVPF